MSKSNNQQPSYAGIARIKCDSSVSNYAVLSVGGIAIPFYEATVHLRSGEHVTIEARIPADHIDLQALEEHTKLTIDKGDQPIEEPRVTIDPGLSSPAA